MKPVHDLRERMRGHAMALTAPTIRAKRHVQSAAEDQRVYDYVTARDKTCRAPAINPSCSELVCSASWIPLERHHAGNTIGSKRITDARHVVLLCEFHHRTWAPTHSRLILQYLKDVEDARERARHDIEEAQR